MAINKAFVIKNGAEVNTKLLVADADTQKVGIGTTIPQYSLHVGGLRGGIGATDVFVSGITTVKDLHVTGITTFDTGRVLIGAGESTGTIGQILHVGTATTEGGVYISGNLGLGVTLPGAKLNVVPGSSAIAGLFSGTTEKDMVRITQLGGGNALRIDDEASDASPFVVTGIGSVGIGTTNPKYALVVDSLVSTGTTALFVHGDAQITGDLIVDDFSLDELDVDQINVTGILTSAQTKLNGITTAANINVTGISTFGGAIDVNSTSDFANNVNISSGSLNISTGGITIGSATTVASNGNASFAGIVTANGGLRVGLGASIHPNGNLAVAGVGTINGGLIVGAGATVSGDLLPEADGTRDLGGSTREWKDLYIDGTANIDALLADTAKIADLTDNRVVIAGASGELEDSGNLTFDGSTLALTGDQTVSGKITVGTGASIHANGNLAVAGVGTINGGLIVGAGATFTGNILPEADGTRDIGASGLEWKDLYIDGTANIDSLIADTAQISDLTNTRVTFAGASGELTDDSTLTFNSTTKILSAQEFVGVHTSAGGGGVGIGSTTGLVGYGFTFINFKGPGVSTVFASSTTGIATIFFQGGGSNAGAAGTWTPEGSIGISTSKSIGVNTTSISDADLQGIGNTFQGVYIGNGMLVTDNQLNGNHYIGTAYNGLMAGPVTVNGVLTVDGNWAVV